MIKDKIIALLICLSIILATWFICDWFFKDERYSKDTVTKTVRTDIELSVDGISYNVYTNVYYWYNMGIIKMESFKNIANIDSLKKECDKRAEFYTKLIKNEPSK